MPRVQSAVGHVWHLRTIAEEDIAMQVAVVRGGGVLVRAERREFTGVVVLVGDFYVFFPDGARHFGAHERFHRSSGQHINQVREHFLNVRVVIGVLENQRLCRGQLTCGRSWRVGFFRYPHIFRVVSNTHEVHGCFDLDVVAQRMLDGLALRILQSIVRSSEAVAHQPGVYRPTSVDVFIAEVGVAIGIGLGLLSIRRLASLTSRLWRVVPSRTFCKKPGRQC